MTPQHTPRRRLAAAALALAAALAACSTSGHDDFGEHDDHRTGVPSGASTGMLPSLPDPWANLDRNNPEAVARAAIAALFDWRPATGDTGPESARDRARPLLTPRAADSYRLYPIPRPLWESWMNTRAQVTASSDISSEQHPADTAVTWERKITTRIHAPEAGNLTATTLITVTKQPVWTVTAVTTLPS